MCGQTGVEPGHVMREYTDGAAQGCLMRVYTVHAACTDAATCDDALKHDSDPFPVLFAYVYNGSSQESC